MDLMSSLYSTLIFYITAIIITLSIYRRYKKNFPEFDFLLVMYLLDTVGIIFMIYRTDLGLFLGIIIANLCLFLATLALYIAVSQRLKKSPNPIFLAIVTMFFILFYYFFTYVELNVSVRIIVFSSFALLMHTAVLLKFKNDFKVPQYTFLLTVSSLNVLNYFVRIVTTSSRQFNSLSFFDYNYDALNVFVLALLNFLILFGFISAYHYEVQMQIEESHKESQKLFEVFKNNPTATAVLNVEGDILLYNQKFADDFYKDNEIIQNFSDLVQENFKDLCDKKVLKSNSTQLVECTILSKGQHKLFDVMVTKSMDKENDLFSLVFMDKTDVIEHKLTIDDYKELLERTKSSASIGFWELDIDSKMIIADEYARDIYDMHDKSDLISLAEVQSIVVKTDRKLLDLALKDLLETGKIYDVTFEILTSANNRKNIHSKAFVSNQSKDKKVIGTIQDITSFVSLQQQAEYFKTHDQLTSVLNRLRFESSLSDEIVEQDLPISIIVADFNRLNDINQTYGFEQGNNALKISANIMKESIKENSIIARIGEDEFGIILYNTDRQSARKVIERIQNEIKRRYSNASQFQLSWTFGSATLRNLSSSILDVYKDAKTDMAKHKAYVNQTTHLKSVDAIIKTLNEKDPYSEIHSQRVAFYAKRLAIKVGLSETKVNEIETAALLHDIGKILCPDTVLLSEKKLTDFEFEEIKKHTLSGYNILSSIPEFKEISKIILAHHERIDGQGYPYNIKGGTIPFESKIIAIADAYDAMTGQRLYRKPYVKEEAILELLHNRGTQFDEELVNVFVDSVLKKDV